MTWTEAVHSSRCRQAVRVSATGQQMVRYADGSGAIEHVHHRGWYEAVPAELDGFTDWTPRMSLATPESSR